MNHLSHNPTNHLSTNFFATLSSRIEKLQAEGTDIIRLDIGSPDLPPADHIIKALSQSALQAESHGYQPHRGTAAIRAAWAKMYQRLYDIDLDVDKEVLPLLGSKEGVFHLSQALLNPGDVVLIPDPGYQTYRQAALFSRAKPVEMPLLPENNYLPDLHALPADVIREAKILWLNYPNNPTAAVAPLDFFVEAVEFCRQHGILLCHDAAYTQVTFDDYQAPSVLEVPGAIDVAVEFNTLSKSHNMAGWRSGVAVGQPEALHALLKIKSHADSGHFHPVIEASQAALTGDQTWIKERNRIYQDRRDKVIAEINNLGFEVQIPEASLYAWWQIPQGQDSDTFVLELLEYAHVSLAPGTIFGEAGRGFARISLVQPLERIEEAMQRIKMYLSAGLPKEAK